MKRLGKGTTVWIQRHTSPFKITGYFMYHPAQHSNILPSDYTVRICVSYGYRTNVIISLYNIN